MSAYNNEQLIIASGVMLGLIFVHFVFIQGI